MLPQTGKGFFNPFRERRGLHSPIPSAIGFNRVPASAYRVRKQRSQSRPTMVLEWVAVGSLELELASRRLTVPEGAALLTLQPLDAWYGGAQNLGSRRIETLWFAVEDPILVEFLLKRLPSRFAILPEQSVAQTLPELFHDLKACRGIHYEALSLRCHDLWRAVAVWVDTRLAPARTDPSFSDAIPIELTENLAEKRKIQRMARRFGLSREHFSRVFLRHVGCTPRAFVAKARMRRLEELLRTTRLGAARAAEAAGYPSYILAARCFLKAHGTGMGAWRKRQAFVAEMDSFAEGRSPGPIGRSPTRQTK